MSPHFPFNFFGFLNSNQILIFGEVYFDFQEPLCLGISTVLDGTQRRHVRFGAGLHGNYALLTLHIGFTNGMTSIKRINMLLACCLRDHNNNYHLEFFTVSR